jgi:hypothetical protein
MSAIEAQLILSQGSQGALGSVDIVLIVAAVASLLAAIFIYQKRSFLCRRKQVNRFLAMDVELDRAKRQGPVGPKGAKPLCTSIAVSKCGIPTMSESI